MLKYRAWIRLYYYLSREETLRARRAAMALHLFTLGSDVSKLLINDIIIIIINLESFYLEILYLAQTVYYVLLCK